MNNDYNMFEPNMKIPPATEILIKVGKRSINKAVRGDALKCPVAIAIKKTLKPECDVLVTTKHVLYYDRPFDRKDIDIVLGRGRICMIPLSEEIGKIIKEFESTGNIEPFNFKTQIPNEVLP